MQGMNKKIKLRGLTRERLIEKVYYNPETGIFNYVRSPNPRADRLHKGTGYTRLQIDGKRYVAHRLAWLYSYGHLPEQEIDHIDGDRQNNKISNLRLAYKFNAQNASTRTDNTSGIKGVDHHKSSGKFRARIAANGIKYDLGLFQTKELAEFAVKSKREKLHLEFTNHG